MAARAPAYHLPGPPLPTSYIRPHRHGACKQTSYGATHGGSKVVSPSKQLAEAPRPSKLAIGVPSS